jgi:hypothetical protein
MAKNKSFIKQKTGLETKRQKLVEKLSKLEAQEKERQRKLDLTQRLIVGHAVIAHAKKNPDFARVLAEILASGVTRADERKIIADLVNLDSATTDNQAVTVQPDEAQAASTLDT